MEKSNDWRSPENAALLNEICVGLNAKQKEQFVYMCKVLDLNPLMRQVYPMLRDGRLTTQTSIDGFRLVAERTGKYAPGKESVYTYDENKRLQSVTVYVRKMTDDGTWHEVSATAHYSEYVALKKGGEPNHFWATKSHIMLSKCAEALALRKAFPAELSGVYTDDEMEQAGNPAVFKAPELDIPAAPAGPTQQQIFEDLLASNVDLKKSMIESIKSKGYTDMNSIPIDVFNRILEWAKRQVVKAGGVA